MIIKTVAGKVLAAMAFAGIAIAVGGQSANAATAQTTFQVSATVTATCSMAAGPLSFGNYTGAQNDASSVINVNCTNGTTPTVIADNGLHSLGGTRNMQDPGANNLSYGIFTDAARSAAFPIGAPGVTAGANGATAITVFGRIPANQNPPAGSYLDTITVIITY